MEEPIEEYSDNEQPAGEARPSQEAPEVVGSGEEAGEEPTVEVSAAVPDARVSLTQELSALISPGCAAAAAAAPASAADAEETIGGFEETVQADGDEAAAAAAAGVAAGGVFKTDEGLLEAVRDPAVVDSDVEDDPAALPAGEPSLAEEHWLSLPERERELWERLRPRSVRREAAQVRALKLPTAAVGRLMRLHPHLPMKSAESVELINYATVLLLQALVKSAAREKGPGRQRVQYGDIRRACVGVRELQFLCPLESTLDASALVMLRQDAAAAAADAEPLGGGAKAAASSRGRGAGRPGAAAAAAAADPNQRKLSLGAFAQAANVNAGGSEGGGGDAAQAEAQQGAGEAQDSESGGEQTPNPQDKPKKPSGKRRAPASAQKAPSKVARRSGGAGAQKAAGTAGGGGGIASFFRRAEAAAGN